MAMPADGSTSASSGSSHQTQPQPTYGPSWCDRAAGALDVPRYWATLFDLLRDELRCFDGGEPRRQPAAACARRRQGGLPPWQPLRGAL
jgi:hypothetical protein